MLLGWGGGVGIMDNFLIISFGVSTLLVKTINEFHETGEEYLFLVQILYKKENL